MDNTTIGYGRTADVRLHDTASVLKLFKPFMSRAAVEREFAVANHARAMGLNTPKPTELVNVDDRTGIVYERIPGKSLLRELSENPFRLNAIARQMAQFHHRLNSVTYDAPENSQKTHIAGAIKAAPVLSESDKERIIAYLLTLPDSDRLCHGDFHPDNILVTDTLWVIDWMTGSSGHPVGDVARSKVILETGEIPDSVPVYVRIFLALGQKKLARAYIREYRTVSGVTGGEINAWLLPLYAARLNENLSPKETAVIVKRIRKEMRKRL